jgi:predicted enzyme related to lactoylglutathione lyase
VKAFFRRLTAACALAGLLAACSATGFTPAGELALSEQPLLGKFVWHDLMTDDVEAAKRFYGGLLGWEFEQATHPGGGDYTLVKAGGHYVGGLVLLADRVDADFSRWLPYLSVADVDSAVRATESAGGVAVVGPLELGNLGRAAAITDPQGAVLGLLRSRVGDPDDSLPPAAGRVVWNELLAADAAGAARFYGGLAGLEIVPVTRRGGEYIMLRAQGRDRAGIMERPDNRVVPLWLTHFAVADVDAAARRATELGGQVLLAPAAELRNGMLAVVTDSTGAVLALQQLPR